VQGLLYVQSLIEMKGDQNPLPDTFAGALSVAGTPINDVANLLDLISLNATRIYAKASETDLASLVQQLEATESEIA
jgi:site-specific recombinase XerD